jgi:hypothetical protein
MMKIFLSCVLPALVWACVVVPTRAQTNPVTKVWDKTYGGSSYDNASAIALAAGGGYIIAGKSFSGISGDKTQVSQGNYDYWIVKIDENGTKVWDKTFGGNGDDRANAITPAPGGGYIIAGYSNSGISGDKSQASQGGNDYWLVKIDENGNKVWDKRFGGSGVDEAKSIVAASGGATSLSDGVHLILAETSPSSPGVATITG